MRTRLLPVDDPRWTAFLEANEHDFFHLPGYVTLSARHTGGEPCAIHVDDGSRAMLLPLLLREIPGSTRDATSPYGYPGPLASTGAGPAFMLDALLAAVEVLGSEGVVSAFLRMHPILNQPPPQGPGLLVLQGDTVAVDLTGSPEDLWGQTRRDHRTQIRRASRVGYDVFWDLDWSYLSQFQSMYRETMIRRGADHQYFFDETYFAGLRAALGERLRLAVTRREEIVAAAGLFVETNGIVQYFLSASEARLEREAAWATKLMIHFVRTWAQAAGKSWLHLGGGVGASEDSLFLFKAGFSPWRFPYYTLRTVIDPKEYERLVREQRPSVEVGEDTNFFPAYRRG